jgi:3-phenylpropionate/cinnamic acid dioxygenase small subunit
VTSEARRTEVQLTADDRAQINDLYVRYAHHFDAADAARWAALYTADGRFSPPGGVDVVGTEALREFVEARASDAPGMRHLIANVLIEPDGDGVRGCAYFFCIRLSDDGRFRLRNVGRYEDQLAREGGAWKFATRRVITELAAGLVDAPFAFALDG